MSPLLADRKKPQRKETRIRAPERNNDSGADFGSLGVVARWAVLVLLAGYLIFAHGCHGDEDNELFNSLAKTFFVAEEK